MRHIMAGMVGVLALFMCCSVLAEGFEIQTIEYQGDGSSLITWGAPKTDEPLFVLIQHQPDGMVQIVDMVEGENTCLTASLIPGETYAVSIHGEKSGDTPDFLYTAPKEDYTDVRTRLGLELKRRTGQSNLKGTKSFSASDILANMETTEFGAYVRVTHSQLKQTRTSKWTLALRLPDGDVYGLYYQQNDLLRGKEYATQVFYYDLTDDFYFINLWKGELPVGDYRMELYFDGKYVDGTVLKMTE